MKTAPLRRGIPSCAIAWLALGAAISATPVHGQSWSGAGVDINWSSGANWTGGVAPASSFATFVTFGPAPSNNSFVDSAWQVNRIDISGPPRNMGGATLSFGGAAASL